MMTTDGVSPGISRFLDGLSEAEREDLKGVLRDSNTYLAEDMDDVIAILNQIRD
tara:strand:+ start:16473 stop:16634 length:162 start_codon:yes stop_codon:yes gene_type:complete